MKNGDTVEIKNGRFKVFKGVLYIDDYGLCEVYVDENKYHSGFYIYCTQNDLI